MKFILGAILALALATTASAGHGGGPEFGRFGGDFGGRFDSFSGESGDYVHGGGLGIDVFGMGLGIGSFDAERQQDRYEQRFESLQTQYDSGVTDITDFFTSDTY